MYYRTPFHIIDIERDRVTEALANAVVINRAIPDVVLQEVKHFLLLGNRQLLKSGICFWCHNPTPFNIFKTVIRCRSGCRNSSDDRIPIRHRGVYPGSACIDIIPQCMGKNPLLLNSQRGESTGNCEIFAPIDVAIEIVGPVPLHKSGYGFFACFRIVIEICTGRGRHLRSIFRQKLSQNSPIEILEVAYTARSDVTSLE